jgi:hypothetical protein
MIFFAPSSEGGIIRAPQEVAMRRLEIVVRRSAGLLPAIAAAALTPLAVSSGCDSEVSASGSSTTVGAGGAAAAGGGGAGTGASTTTGGTGASTTTNGTGASSMGGGGAGGSSEVSCEWGETTFVVLVPPEGVAATEAAICAAAEPVESNVAGRITLHRYSQALELATGTLLLEPGLTVVGSPTIQVIEAGYPEMMLAQITAISPIDGGFTFHVQWPAPLQVNPDEWASMTWLATMDVSCAGSGARLVQARTYINLCIAQGQAVWVSSGDECTACTQICEMAPGPTLSGASPGGRALSRAVRLALVEIARVGRSVIVLAEHDGGPGLRYRWQARGGQLTELAPDVVHWSLPEVTADRHLQLAVVGPDCVAAASLRVA